MNKESKFMKVNLSFGHWIYNFILLQFLPVFYTLKGFILFGFFPSVTSTFNILYQWIAFSHYDLSISNKFKEYYEKYFWESNKLGWTMTGVGALLVFDLYISTQFIQSILFHTVLIGLFFIYLMISSYLFLVFARYEYGKLRDYIKQSFFIGISSIFQSIAILLAIVIVSYIFYYVPFITLFFGIPLLFGAISWFAIQGILKAENMRREKDT